MLALPFLLAAAGLASANWKDTFTAVGTTAATPSNLWTYGCGEMLWGQIENCDVCDTGYSTASTALDTNRTSLTFIHPNHTNNRKYQSPVNLPKSAKLVNPTKPDTSKWANIAKCDSYLTYDGNGMLLNPTDDWGFTTVIGGITFKVTEIDFMTPSEHSLDGVYYPLEVQFVHEGTNKRGATVMSIFSVFFEYGSVADKNDWVAQFEKLWPTGMNGKTLFHTLDVSAIKNLFKKTEFYHYKGSVTAPPCTEGVVWQIATTPLLVSPMQLNTLRDIVGFSSRYQQDNLNVDEQLLGK
ncbi:alpha carbonic anhydrase [Chytriomyces sp. MP71]|nr:alpha carbonic anhydrase [Chytriomyces sp. MP71]